MEKMKRKSIVTKFGLIKGRNALYLDDFRHNQETGSIDMIGEISTGCLSAYSGKEKFIKYSIGFQQAIAIKAWEYELYPFELNKTSSLDVEENSSWASEFRILENEDYSKFTHYIVTTYDFVYEIFAKDFLIDILDERRVIKKL